MLSLQTSIFYISLHYSPIKSTNLSSLFSLPQFLFFFISVFFFYLFIFIFYFSRDSVFSYFLSELLIFFLFVYFKTFKIVSTFIHSFFFVKALHKCTRLNVVNFAFRLSLVFFVWTSVVCLSVVSLSDRILLELKMNYKESGTDVCHKY